MHLHLTKSTVPNPNIPGWQNNTILSSLLPNPRKVWSVVGREAVKRAHFSVNPNRQRLNPFFLQTRNQKNQNFKKSQSSSSSSSFCIILEITMNQRAGKKKCAPSSGYVELSMAPRKWSAEAAGAADEGTDGRSLFRPLFPFWNTAKPLSTALVLRSLPLLLNMSAHFPCAIEVHRRRSTRARAHTHTLSRSISPVLVLPLLWVPVPVWCGLGIILPLHLVPVPVPVPVWCMVLWSSSLFIWFRFQFGAWSCDRPLSSSGSGSSLVRGLVIVLSLHLVPVPVWCVVLWFRKM